MPEYGLTDKDILNIQNCCAEIPAIDQAILYGSRAMGTQRLGSDIVFYDKNSREEKALG